MNCQPFAFRDWIRQQGSPYSIVAAEASVDELVAQLQKRFRIERHQVDVPRVGTLAELPGVPVVKFKDSPWVVVYWSVGRSPLLQDDCQTFSKMLNTRVIHIAERDTAQWSEWFLYQSGNDLEFSEECHDEVYFESSLRPQADFDDLKPNEIRPALDKSLDELLKAIELNIPSLDLHCADSSIEYLSMLKISESPLGMRDFQKGIYQGHPEYEIFAVKAPIDQVGKTLQRNSQITGWQKQVQVNNQSVFECVAAQSGYWIPMLQPKEKSWTVVYWIVGNWESVDGVCEKLSSILQTRVMSLGEEDTSGALGYCLYNNGKIIESGGYGDEFYFDSEIREEPEFSDDDFRESEFSVTSRFVDAIFAQEGIYVPFLDISISDPWLKRVDLIERA